MPRSKGRKQSGTLGMPLASARTAASRLLRIIGPASLIKEAEVHGPVSQMSPETSGSLVESPPSSFVLLPLQDEYQWRQISATSARYHDSPTDSPRDDSQSVTTGIGGISIIDDVVALETPAHTISGTSDLPSSPESFQTGNSSEIAVLVDETATVLYSPIRLLSPESTGLGLGRYSSYYYGDGPSLQGTSEEEASEVPNSNQRSVFREFSASAPSQSSVNAVGPSHSGRHASTSLDFDMTHSPTISKELSSWNPSRMIADVASKDVPGDSISTNANQEDDGEQAALTEENMKVYQYLRGKRTRTISSASMETHDGTGSSITEDSTPATGDPLIRAPPLEVRMMAVQDWLTDLTEVLARVRAQGRRCLRPGLVFEESSTHIYYIT